MTAIGRQLRRWLGLFHGASDSTQCFRDFYENAADAIFTCDLAGHFSSMNPAGLKITGYTAAEFVNMPLEKFIAPDYLPLAQSLIARCIAGEILPLHEMQVICKNGLVRFVEINIWPLRRNGHPIGIQGIARDITERKKTQEAALKNEQRFRHLADLLPQTVFECDLQGRFLFLNRASFPMFGYSTSDAVNDLTVFHMLKPDDVARAKENMAALISGKATNGNEYTARKKDGSFFPVLIFSAPIQQNGTVNGMRGILIDVSERRKLELQLRKSQRMESVGHLAAGIAHDFNNILTIVHGHASLLLSHRDVPPVCMESATQIVCATRKGTDLIRHLLAFSRKQIMQPKPLDINEIVTGLSHMLPSLLGESITLQIQCSPRLPLVKIDAAMMEQVVMNLAVNSRDAMPKGGALTIKTSVCVRDANSNRASADARIGRFVVLTVADNGCGMDKEVLGRLFEPFFSTKEASKGTGLGLSTVFGIVKQHEGWIDVNSVPQKGTEFSIYLPICNGNETPQRIHATQKEDTAPIQGGSERILVVEDEPSVRQMICSILKPCGYEVHEAASGRDALELPLVAQSPIDLLITDMVMPGGVSGRELALRMRNHQADLKVIYISGFSMELLGVSPDWLKNDVFLSKPFSPRALIKTVRHCLDKQLGAVST